MKRSPIRKISDKQKEELALRRKIKVELIKRQLDSVGFIFCENCGNRPDWRGIQLRHRVALSQGGKTDKKNCSLWCTKCHFTKDHGIIEAEELSKYWD